MKKIDQLKDNFLKKESRCDAYKYIIHQPGQLEQVNFGKSILDNSKLDKISEGQQKKPMSGIE